MKIAILIVVAIIVLCFMSLGGWILHLIEMLLGVLFEGVGNCLGCLLKFGFWILIIIMIGLLLAE